MGRGYETGLPHQNRSPGLTMFINGSQQNEGKLGKEVPMLVGHMVTDKLTSDFLHFCVHTQPLLDEDFFGMEGRRWGHDGLMAGCCGC